MGSIYLCFVLIVALMTVIACLKSNQVEHFKKFNWNSCVKPNEWVEKHCWKQRVWNKQKQFHIKQRRCNIYCGKPKLKVEPQAECKTEECPPCPSGGEVPSCLPCPSEGGVPSNSSGAGGSNAQGNTHDLVNPAKLEIKDDKYNQIARFQFENNFASPTLDFNDTYNKVELLGALGGGEAMVCRKNYNELCRGNDLRRCRLLPYYCVTLNEKNPNMDFRLTEDKKGRRLKNDLSSVKITRNMGNTRVRLSKPKDDAVRKRVPNELIVHHADKLAWNDAVSHLHFDKGEVTLHNDPFHRGLNTKYNTPGGHEIKDRNQKRKANAIRYYFKR